MNPSSFTAVLNPEAQPSARPTPGVPLYVDLDGTLTYSDLLFESFLLLVKRNPLYIFMCFVWLFRGPAHLKAELARRVELDVACLPYNESLVQFLRAEHEKGRRIVLASASNAYLVQAVAEHFSFFDTWLASDASSNRKGLAKLEAIRADAKGAGFAYAGNGHVDVSIWKEAQEIIVVNADAAVVSRASKLQTPKLIVPARKGGVRVLAKALRLHQWAKNGLLFVPLLASHSMDLNEWLSVALAFIAFGLCASSTYIVNDLLDLAADRQHPRKRMRPFASGMLSIPAGAALILICMPLSIMLAWHVSPLFFAMVLFYTVLTLAYSLVLKRITFIDVLVLAFLYTYRVIAGGVASDNPVSNWLLAVSLFMFLSLALVKRCAELEDMIGSGKAEVAGRGYRTTDLTYLMSMGISSGFMATMVLALYIDAQADGTLYPYYELLWLTVPVLLYWMMRLWLKTSRGEMRDDPLQFALTDRPSWCTGILIGCIALAATLGPAL